MCKKVTCHFVVFLVVTMLVSSCQMRKSPTATNIQLDPIYTSNMVFRQGDSIVVKGTCNGNGLLKVFLENGIRYVQANDKGVWRVSLPPIDYKGEFKMVFEGVKQSIELNNLRIGQVWVVVGDAWMPDVYDAYSDEKVLSGVGSDANVRIYSPSSLLKQGGATKGQWKTLSNNKQCYRAVFSGVLGQQLAENCEQTIGVINLTHAGTQVNNFDALKVLKADSIGHADSLWIAYFNRCARFNYLADSSFKGIEKGVLDRFADDWDWNDVNMPLITSKRWYMKDKIVWLRKNVYIPAKYITSDFTVNMGALRGQYKFYVNGTEVANVKGEHKEFIFSIADSLLKPWSNLLTVRMVAGDPLSGIYSENITVSNADFTYSRNINEEWLIRTYYEPGLPSTTKDEYLWPKVNENYLKQFENYSVDGLVCAGGARQYIDCNAEAVESMLTALDVSFAAKNKYLYLLPLPSYIDSLVNINYYNQTRNLQLLAAANANWKTINVLDVDINNSYLPLQFDMAEKLAMEVE